MITQGRLKATSTAKWTDELRTTLVMVLVDRTNMGVFTDSGFKSADWKWIQTEFNGKAGQSFDKSQLQSQCGELKKKYGIVSALRANSGFGWDHDKDLPTAPDDVWDKYLSAHPKAAPFRYTALPNRGELEVVFEGKSATGEFAMSTGFAATTRPQAQKQLNQTDHSTPDKDEDTDVPSVGLGLGSS